MKPPDTNDLLRAGALPLDPRDGTVPYSPPAERPEGARSTSRPVIVSLDTVERRTVRWLWYPRIPLGLLTFLDGWPGQGKTQVACRIAANLTRGLALPDSTGTVCEPANVVYMTGEDGLSETLRPRIEDAGGDLSRVKVLTGVNVTLAEGKQVEVPFTLRDVEILDATMREHHPLLVVVDPIQSYFGADVDLHRANETRPILSGLHKIAQRYGVAFLLIRHLNKSSGGNLLLRGLGSVDLAGAARSILTVVPHPEDKPDAGRRVVLHVKANVGPIAPALGFTVGASGFAWTGRSEVTEAQVRAAEVASPRERRRDGATEWLKSQLSAGPVPVEELKDRADGAAIAWRTVRRAKDDLRVVAEKSKGSLRGGWYWQLPGTDSAVFAEDGQSSLVAPLAPFGNLAPFEDGQRLAKDSSVYREIEGSSALSSEGGQPHDFARARESGKPPVTAGGSLFDERRDVFVEARDASERGAPKRAR